MKRALGTLAAVAILAASGCEGDVSTAPPSNMTAEAPAPPAPEPPGGGERAAKASEAADAAPAPMPEPAAAGEGAAADDAGQFTTEKAAVGAGRRGRDYGGPGFVTTPVQEYFRTGERIAFDIQIPSAMKIYKAEHNNKGPKTHEEFMDIIIKENAVHLPDLPAGEEYVYDPASEQLLVKKPAQ